MPVLHRYKDGATFYAKSSLAGRIVTWQLSPGGQRKLQDAGIGDGTRFPLHLLADLMRAGDAWTGGSGLGEVAVQSDGSQLHLDFPEDREAAALFPLCEVTGSLHDLHLVVWQEGATLRAQLLAPAARSALTPPHDLSTPVAILDLKSLNRLRSLEKIPAGSAAEGVLRRWFEADASAAWERWRKRPAAPQGRLLAAPGELDFS